MAYQVNLLNTSLRPPKRYVSARQAATATAGVAAAAAALGVFVLLEAVETERQRDLAKARLESAQEQFKKLAAEPAKGRNKSLEDEVARLEQGVRGREALLVKIDGGIGNATGFSGYLDALARRTLEGVWLTRVVVGTDDSEFSLQGRVTRAELVGQYIRLLNQEQVLRGRKISEMNLSERELPVPAAPPAPQPVRPVAGAATGPAAVSTAPAAPPSAGPAPVPTVRVVEFSLGAVPAQADAKAEERK